MECTDCHRTSTTLLLSTVQIKIHGLPLLKAVRKSLQNVGLQSNIYICMLQIQGKNVQRQIALHNERLDSQTQLFKHLNDLPHAFIT